MITTTGTTWSVNLALGVHTWRVRAFNVTGASEWSDSWTIEIAETLPAPSVPILLSPSTGTITTTQTITLYWQAAPGGAPAGYNVEVDGTVVTKTATTSATVLSFGTHVWRVRAFNNVGYSGWSDAWTVEVIQSNNAPYTPSSPSPADGATDVSTAPTLSWQGGDPDGHTVTYQVAFGTASVPPLVAEDVTTTNYTPGALVTNTIYYWQITATDSLSTTQGPVWHFTTGSTLPPPGTPELISPLNGTVVTGSQNINFSWRAGVGMTPVGYNLDLNGGVITTTGTSRIEMLDPGQYTWRVRAYNDNGYSSWTDGWSIEVKSPAGPDDYDIYLPLALKNR